MRWRLERRLATALLAAACLTGAAALADAPDEADDATRNAAAAEHRATTQIQALHGSARKLRQLARRVAKSGAAPDYAAWLEGAHDRVDGLARRWKSGIDLYRREFPPDSLTADPERAGHAERWLSAKTAEFRAQVRDLQAELLGENTGFDGAPADALGRARAILDGLVPADPPG